MGFLNEARKRYLRKGNVILSQLNKFGSEHFPAFTKKVRSVYKNTAPIRQKIGLGLETAANVADTATGLLNPLQNVENVVKDFSSAVKAGRKLKQSFRGNGLPNANRSNRSKLLDRRQAMKQNYEKQERAGNDQQNNRGINPDKLNNMLASL
jgi:hypothetical protein